MHRLLICAFSLSLWLGLAGASRAADLTISVHTPDGHPVAGAVVTFKTGSSAPGAIHFPWPYRIAQQNIQFNPRLLIVPVGATVAFPNLDSVRHHVYSFATGNRFELRLYGHDETRTVVFNSVGVAAIGCNIHDQMSAYVVVVDTPNAAVTDDAGRATFHDVSGTGELKVWRQDIRAPGGQVTQSFAVNANTNRDVSVDIRPAAAMRMH